MRSDDDDGMTRNALRGLRSSALRAQRRREPALMIAIGLADPEESEERDEDDEDDDEMM